MESLFEFFKRAKGGKQAAWDGWEWNLPHFQALVMADCHGTLTWEEFSDFLEGREPDAVFLLGDNFGDDLEILKRYLDGKTIDVFGVEGNHDFCGLLRDHGIENLHCKVIEWNGIRIGGFGGSIRYKEDGGYVMYTNEESECLLRSLPKCDILLTHDFPCFKKSRIITPHSGLTGIANYIRENKPAINLHGHLHERRSDIIYGTGTQVRCCYRLELISF